MIKKKSLISEQININASERDKIHSTFINLLTELTLPILIFMAFLILKCVPQWFALRQPNVRVLCRGFKGFG